MPTIQLYSLLPDPYVKNRIKLTTSIVFKSYIHSVIYAIYVIYTTATTYTTDRDKNRTCTRGWRMNPYDTTRAQTER